MVTGGQVRHVRRPLRLSCDPAKRYSPSTMPTMFPRSSGRWVLALLALAACDLRNPADPLAGPMPLAGEAAERAEAVLVGSYSAPTAQPLPGVITSYQPPTHSTITVQPNRYVLLRISGTLRAQDNPYRLGAVPDRIVASYTPVEAGQSTSGQRPHHPRR